MILIRIDHPTRSHPLKRAPLIRIYLPSEQREMLEKARRIRTPNLAERCLAVLLSDRGQSVPVIAESIGRHDHTIRSWLKAYIQDGVSRGSGTPRPLDAPIARSRRL